MNIDLIDISGPIKPGNCDPDPHSKDYIKLKEGHLNRNEMLVILNNYHLKSGQKSKLLNLTSKI